VSEGQGVTIHDRENTADASGDAIGQLLKLAGARRMPDAAQMDRARAAAHAEWTAGVQHRTHRRRVAWMLAAAAVAASVVGGLGWPWLAGRRMPAVVRPGIAENAVIGGNAGNAGNAGIASLRTVAGSVFLITTDGRRSSIGTGARIGAGDRVETSNDGRAAFVLTGAGGVSVRLDRATAIVLDRDGEVTLERGAAYVDSGGEPGAANLEIKTAFGSVRHVGTQFEVRLQDSLMRVSVREGAVAVERAGTRWTSKTGEALTLSRGGPPVRETIPTFGADWTWVSGLADPFLLEGARVPAFLRWVSREQGWRWQVEDPRMLDRIEQIVLHGSIDGLTPEEALSAVLPTCGLTFRLEGDRLIVGIARTQ
jgi:ferric-dicitrate binding protein FerR (iron transport regulator)